MKKINLNISPLVVAMAIISVGIIATAVYAHMQIDDLKGRVTSAENRLDDYGFGAYDGVLTGDEHSLDIEVLSSSDATINVPSADNEGAFNPKSITARAVKIKITNPSNSALDFSGNISAKLNSTGKMITPVEPDTSDPLYETVYFSVAPNSEAEVTLFFELKPGQEIVSLYDTGSMKSYDL